MSRSPRRLRHLDAITFSPQQWSVSPSTPPASNEPTVAHASEEVNGRHRIVTLR